MKRIICMLLAFVLILTCLPALPAAAVEASDGEMHVSQALLDKIKLMEGFSSKPYWDYQQYSIGYGSLAGYSKSEVPEEYWDGITEKQAEALLKKEINERFEKPVMAYAAKNGLKFNQNEFDALVSFSYNCGTAWTSGCMITTWLTSDPSSRTDISFVKAMGAWCRAGGCVLPGLCRRRIDEARMFLYGDYTGTKSQQYYYIIYHAVKSTMSSGKEDMASYYMANKSVGFLPIPNSKSGLTFVGWFTAAGVQVSSETVIGKDMQLYAHWKDAQGNILGPDDPVPAPPVQEPEPVNPEAHEVFKDVKESSWYAPYVTRVYREGLFGGMTEDTFGPNESMTRGMLVTVLYRLAGEPDVTGDCVFSDVGNRYYRDPIIWAQANGIVNGITDTVFSPNDRVTREQIAAILYRYCENYLGLSMEEGTSLSGFQDSDRIHSYALEAMEWAVACGLMDGMTETELAPRDNATRAQVAALLTRLMDNVLP